MTPTQKKLLAIKEQIAGLTAAASVIQREEPMSITAMKDVWEFTDDGLAILHGITQLSHITSDVVVKLCELTSCKTDDCFECPFNNMHNLESAMRVST